MGNAGCISSTVVIPNIENFHSTIKRHLGLFGFLNYQGPSTTGGHSLLAQLQSDMERVLKRMEVALPTDTILNLGADR